MMKYLRSFVESYFPCRPAPNTWSDEMINPKKISDKVYCRNKLSALPLELFFQISDFLSPVDLTCLSVCEYQFFCWLSMRYHGLPHLVADEKLLLLIRLERDIPEYFACYVCKRLHRYDGSESFGLSGMAHRKVSRLPCDDKTYELEAELGESMGMGLRTHTAFEHSRNRLSYHQLKLAMRRFNYGATAGISTESLSYTQVLLYGSHRLNPWDMTTYFVPPITTLFSIEGQICLEPLGLYIRMQDIMLLQTWDDSKVDPKENPMRLYEICCHTALLSRQYDLDRLHDGEKPDFTYTCPRCQTECVIEIFEFNSQTALLMTRWMNLGLGLDHRDPLWSIHAWRSSKSLTPRQLPKSMMIKSPRLCFESTASETFQEVRFRNLSYLRGKQYRKGKPFARVGRSTWHISYQDSTMKTGIGYLCPWPGFFERTPLPEPSIWSIIKETQAKRPRGWEWEAEHSDNMGIF
ncbi:hypothetical protein N7528_005207 [Penicillium herquei]|nr:hypothetical protein N7528_005207 [Penicillium herquei]